MENKTIKERRINKKEDKKRKLFDSKIGKSNYIKKDKRGKFCK